MKFLKWLSAVLFTVVLIFTAYVIYYCTKYGVPPLFIDILAEIDEFAAELFNRRLK